MHVTEIYFGNMNRILFDAGHGVTITAHITCSDLTGVSYETSTTFVTP